MKTHRGVEDAPRCGPEKSGNNLWLLNRIVTVNSPAFSRSLVLSQLRFLAFSLVNRVVESREPGAGERLRAGSQGPGAGAGSQRARATERSRSLGRHKKHPEHKEKAEILMNSLLDEVVSLWTSEERPELKSIAAEVEISTSKLRKLLITAGERDGVAYFTSATADTVVKMRREGRSVAEIQEKRFWCLVIQIAACL